MPHSGGGEQMRKSCPLFTANAYGDTRPEIFSNFSAFFGFFVAGTLCLSSSSVKNAKQGKAKCSVSSDVSSPTRTIHPPF
jgi:hypothetical protein